MIAIFVFSPLFFFFGAQSSRVQIEVFYLISSKIATLKETALLAVSFRCFELSRRWSAMMVRCVSRARISVIIFLLRTEILRIAKIVVNEKPPARTHATQIDSV